jgi:cbb3-type cytochrome c oxidase subunit II
VRLAGRDIYIREGCFLCHSQMIRPFRAETERYGHYSVAGEFVYDHPFQWGSKRTGPDLHRVGGRYSDEWHRAHLINPRDVVPESNMPAFAWLAKNRRPMRQRARAKMSALRKVGVPIPMKKSPAPARSLKARPSWTPDRLPARDGRRTERRQVSHGYQRSAIRRDGVSLLTFLGIVWWAYGVKSNKQRFEQAANLPFADAEADRPNSAFLPANEQRKNHERFCE